LRIRSHRYFEIALVLSVVLLMNTAGVHGETSEISAARTDIVKAFQAIQTAEVRGASQADLQLLIDQLNLALELEENATLEQSTDPNQASSDALQSINIATNVYSAAQDIGSLAETNTRNQTVLAYSIALAAAALSGLAIMQVERIVRFLRNRQLRRAAIRTEAPRPAK
jgi:hypothetical protein